MLLTKIGKAEGWTWFGVKMGTLFFNVLNLSNLLGRFSKIVNEIMCFKTPYNKCSKTVIFFPNFLNLLKLSVLIWKGDNSSNNMNLTYMGSLDWLNIWIKAIITNLYAVLIIHLLIYSFQHLYKVLLSPFHQRGTEARNRGEKTWPGKSTLIECKSWINVF